MSQFFEPSPKALKTSTDRWNKKYDFPFDTVPVGMSFPVAKDEVISLDTLRTLASRMGKKTNKHFRVIDHGDTGFEVFCHSVREIKEVPPNDERTV